MLALSNGVVESASGSKVSLAPMRRTSGGHWQEKVMIQVSKIVAD
jgi:hypothetical protein